MQVCLLVARTVARTSDKNGTATACGDSLVANSHRAIVTGS